MNKVNYIFIVGLLNTAIDHLRTYYGIDSKSKFYIKFEERPLTVVEKKAFLLNHEGKKKPTNLQELKVSLYYLDPVLNIDTKYVSMRCLGAYTKVSKELATHSLYVGLISRLLTYLYEKDPSIELVIQGTYGRGNNKD